MTTPEDIARAADAAGAASAAAFRESLMADPTPERIVGAEFSLDPIANVAAGIQHVVEVAEEERSARARRESIRIRDDDRNAGPDRELGELPLGRTIEVQKLTPSIGKRLAEIAQGLTVVVGELECVAALPVSDVNFSHDSSPSVAADTSTVGDGHPGRGHSPAGESAPEPDRVEVAQRIVDQAEREYAHARSRFIDAKRRLAEITP